MDSWQKSLNLFIHEWSCVRFSNVDVQVSWCSILSDFLNTKRLRTCLGKKCCSSCSRCSCKMAPPLPQIACRGVGVCVYWWTFELCHRELSNSQQGHPRWIGRRRETRLKFEIPISAFYHSLCLSFRLSLLLSIPIPVLSTLFWVFMRPRAYIMKYCWKQVKQ